MSHVPAECQATCPASTVTIQPPPFVLHIPGPALHCPDQPFHIEQHNPCVTGVHGALPPPEHVHPRSEHEPIRSALFASRATVPRYTSFFAESGRPFCNAYGCRY